MTKFQALYRFFSSFGIPAYEENSFYAGNVTPEFPYITYNISTSAFQDGEITLNPSLWYRSTSWKEPEGKASEISAAISIGGVQITCEDGYIWLKRGNPFYISMGDESDKFIKRIYFNIIAEFLTKN